MGTWYLFIYFHFLLNHSYIMFSVTIGTHSYKETKTVIRVIFRKKKLNSTIGFVITR